MTKLEKKKYQGIEMAEQGEDVFQQTEKHSQGEQRGHILGNWRGQTNGIEAPGD